MSVGYVLQLWMDAVNNDNYYFIEPTSGNTGIALSVIGALKGVQGNYCYAQNNE